MLVVVNTRPLRTPCMCIGTPKNQYYTSKNANNKILNRYKKVEGIEECAHIVIHGATIRCLLSREINGLYLQIIADLRLTSLFFFLLFPVLNYLKNNN